jgi:hypothetical protein
VATVVAHQEHMRGVGTVWLGRLGQIARDYGLDRLVADVLTENYLMRKVMSDAGWPCTYKLTVPSYGLTSTSRNSGNESRC